MKRTQAQGASCAAAATLMALLRAVALLVCLSLPCAAGERASEDRAIAAAGAREAGLVHVGMYLRALPELDLKTNSYLADFYLWFRWDRSLGVDPSQTFEFTNAVQSWDLKMQPLYTDAAGSPAPEDLGGGALYQIYHVHGRFQTPFDLHDYPFDRQTVRIELEESESLVDELTYAWDIDGETLHPGLTIPGWTVESSRAEVAGATYPTNFGDTRNRGAHDRYSRFTYLLSVERPIVGYLVKTILPITVVMLITFVCFFIELRYFEGRIGLAITGLISAVALQLTSGSELPDVGYMVLLDKIYNLSYFVIFIALAESVLAVRLSDSGHVELAKRLDRFGVIASALVFFGGSLLVTLLGA